MADLANTNSELVGKMNVVLNNEISRENSIVMQFTTPVDGGPYSNGWFQLDSVTNGDYSFPGYQLLVNSVSGPSGTAVFARDEALQYRNDSVNATSECLTLAGQAASSDSGAQLANTNANIANSNAWVAKDAAETANTNVFNLVANNGSGVLFANAQAWIAEGLAQTAKTDAETANTNSNIANTNANIANNGAWAANTAVYELIFNNGDGVFAANASAWVAEGAAVTANTNGQIANTNANTANAGAWRALATLQPTSSSNIANALGFAPYNAGPTNSLGGGFGVSVTNPSTSAESTPLYLQASISGHSTQLQVNMGAYPTTGFSTIEIEATSTGSGTILSLTSDYELNLSAHGAMILNSGGSLDFESATIPKVTVAGGTSLNMTRNFQGSISGGNAVIFTHSLNNRFPAIIVANSGGYLVTPSSILYTSGNACTITVTTTGIYTVSAIG